MEDTETSETRKENQTERYRTIVEESNDIATIIDTDGTMTYVSPSVTRVLGYDLEELVGNTGYWGCFRAFDGVSPRTVVDATPMWPVRTTKSPRKAQK